jgi:hypothetical protein
MNYTNIPAQPGPMGTDSTVQVMNNYYTAPLELKASVYDAIVGFFTSKGFDQTAAQSITVTIIGQAKLDGYNPMIVLDTLKNLAAPELNAFVTEIINFNRFKTSFLGYSNQFTSVSEVARHIVA